MPATFVVVPQWQGSGSARAMRLIDGAEAIRGDLPASATRVVEVPSGPGEALETGVRRYSSIVRVRERLLDELAGVPGTPIVIGGDCGVALAAVEHAAHANGEDLAVVWFDAHPDLNTPESSPSGSFGGMVLRTLIGDGAEGIVPVSRVRADRVLLVGARDIDQEEESFIRRHGVPVFDVDDLADPSAIVGALREMGVGRIHVHVDLDVLDPAVITGIDTAIPFGLTVEQMTATIAALRGAAELVGASIAGFAPSDPARASDDLPAILRIIGALTRS